MRIKIWRVYIKQKYMSHQSSQQNGILLQSYMSGLHHSSSSMFPAMSLGYTTFLLLLLRSQLYLWASPFFCIPAISLGFTILLLLLLHSRLCLWALPFIFFLCVCSQLYLWDALFFFFIPSYISGVHHFG